MARLNYLNDPEHMRKFEAANTVYATRREWREAVYCPLRLVDEGGRIQRDLPTMDIPISGRAELEALLCDCREIKGECAYDALDLHDAHFSPGSPR